MQGRSFQKPETYFGQEIKIIMCGIYLIRMEPEASLTLPSVSATMARNLYYYEGNEINIEGKTIEASNRVKLTGDQEITITNGSQRELYFSS